MSYYRYKPNNTYGRALLKKKTEFMFGRHFLWGGKRNELEQTVLVNLIY